MTENVKIYKLTCDDPELIYYGSTTQPLSSRKSSHNYEYKNRNQYSSRVLYEIGNVKIHLLEECSEDKRNERERYYQENFQCVNKKLEGQTKQECSIRKNKKRYEKNKDKLNEASREKYERKWEEYHTTVKCECGVIIQKYNLNKHRKSKKHLHLCDTFGI